MPHSEPRPTEARRGNDRGWSGLRRAVSALPGWAFFVGILAGWGACAFAGRVVSQQPGYEAFRSWFAPLARQGGFYPTASQLVAHVRAHAPKDKILVLVGGTTTAGGPGQDGGEVWSAALQRELGRKYAVVNFAMDEGSLTADSAVVFAMLAPEYPQMIYVANGGLIGAPSPDGGLEQNAVFWEAYYKGLLPSAVATAPAVQEMRKRQFGLQPAERALHWGAWLDRFAYGRDLWTYVSARNGLAEKTAPGARDLGRARPGETDARQAEARAKRATRTGLIERPAGHWEPDPRAWARFDEELGALMPAELRPRCYVELLPAQPALTPRLTEEERGRAETIYRLSREAYERAGYQLVPLGDGEFTADDVGEGGELRAAGGAKLAKAVARRFEDTERIGERAVPLGSAKIGPIEVGVALPKDRTPRVEPLFAIISGPNVELISVEYLNSTDIRLAYRAKVGAAPIYSPPISAAFAETIHTFRVSTGSLYPRTAAETNGRMTTEELASYRAWLLVRVNEVPLWEAPIAPRDTPPGDVALGVNPFATTPGDRFTGMFYIAERRPLPRRALRRDAIGGARLSLTLSPAMAGHSYPLATTGKAGASDVLFLRVNEKGNAVIGYDHAGAAPQLSPEILLGFATPHTLEFRLPALAGDAAPDVMVSLDGKPVWQQRVLHYRPAPEAISFGQNPIGASSAEATLPNAEFENILVPSWR